MTENQYQQLKFPFDSECNLHLKNVNTPSIDDNKRNLSFDDNKLVEWCSDHVPCWNWASFRYHDVKLWIKSTYQKLRYGVSDEECWGLDRTIAEFVLKRLKHFKKMKRYGVPCDLSDREWEMVIDELIWTFEYSCDEDKFNPCPSMSEAWNSEGVSNWLNREKSPEEKKAWDKYFSRSQELEHRRKLGLRLFSERFFDLWD